MNAPFTWSNAMGGTGVSGAGKMRINLKELQEKNCRGCRFATPEKVGTGRPCCTYPGMPRIEGDKCLTKKETKHDSL